MVGYAQRYPYLQNNSDCSLSESHYHLVLQYLSRTSENIVLRSVLTALSNGDSFVKLSLRYPMTAEV